MTSIYVLCEPGTRIVRYIGKTSYPKRRLKQHLRESKRTETHLGRWLRSLSGVPPTFMILGEVLEAEGSAEEIRYIAAAKMLGMNLVNSTDGGEGVTLTDEIRAKMSAASKGIPKSATHRAAISATKTGVPNSPKHCAAISAAQKGRIYPPQWRAAISAAKKGVPKSPEARAAMSKAKKGVPWSVARRAAQDSTSNTPLQTLHFKHSTSNT